MRIAVVHDLPSGGAKRLLHDQLDLLSGRHEFDLFRLATADATFLNLRQFVREVHVYDFGPPVLLPSPLGRLNRLSRLLHLRRLDALSRRLASDIDGRGYDVVLAEPSMWSQAPLLLRYLRTPSVYVCHELPRTLHEAGVEDGVTQPPWRPRFDQLDPFIAIYLRVARALDVEATKSASVLVANSQHMSRLVEQNYGRTPVINYPGVNVDKFCPSPEVHPRGYVLSVGAIQGTKGFDFVIESLACIPAERRPPLRIVANEQVPQVRAYLESLALRLGLDLSVEVRVSDAELVQRYREASILVYAPRNEPFGLAVLEAMASGRPVVAVKEGGVLETVVHESTGLLVPRDRTLFAEAVSRLLREPDLADQYGRAGRDAAVKGWNARGSADRLEQLLLMASPPRTSRAGQPFAPTAPGRAAQPGSDGTPARGCRKVGQNCARG